MSPTIALVIMLIALAAFAVITVRRAPGHDQAAPAAAAQDQLRGFVYVGSGAAVVLGLVVAVISGVGSTGWWAGTMAVIGFFGYCVYLGIAFVLYRRATTSKPSDPGPRHARGEEVDDISRGHP